MKYILAIIIFVSVNSFGQNKYYQVKDYIYRYDSISVTAIPFSISEHKGIKLMSGETKLAVIYSDGLVLWDAELSVSNISDTLSASGITGMCRITIPTTVNSQRIIQYGDWAIIYQNTSYSISGELLPITITRIADGKPMCTIYNGFNVDWHITPQWASVGRVGTTRIKRITL